jgi:hypothetical protein
VTDREPEERWQRFFDERHIQVIWSKQEDNS